MGNKEICIRKIMSLLKSEIEGNSLNKYRYLNIEKQVAFRYESNQWAEMYLISLDIIVLKNINEDDYGFTISYELKELPFNKIRIKSEMIKASGVMIIPSKEFIYPNDTEIMNDLINQQHFATFNLLESYLQ